MTQSIKVTEKGQPFRIATDFNMSTSTGLEIVFTAPPGGTSFTVNQGTTPAVTAPAIALINDKGFDPVRSVASSEYLEYITDGTEFDVAGTWTACGEYSTAALTLKANLVTFTIGAECS